MKELYREEALSQIPRLLSLLDRNEYSPTFGCFYRPYWHDKVVDFPCAHPQLAVLALALVFKHDMLENPYFLKDKILRWCAAGIRFWTEIQHHDGSFDEHYPNEHSLGAAAWTLACIIQAHEMIQERLAEEEKSIFLEAYRSCANFLAREKEPGKLTNHTALAAFALYKTGALLKERAFLSSAGTKINDVLEAQSKEGWFVEYDGPDLGYQTTTISFLAKYYRSTGEKKVFEALERAIEFVNYFIFPDYSYGGMIGNRHTSHFHPHGFEILATEIPLAGEISNAVMEGIRRGSVLKPKEMDDKHFPNLLIEFLQSYIDYTPRSYDHLNLAWRAKPFQKTFEEANVIVIKKPMYYAVANMRKGGVVKIFNNSRLVFSDSGFVGITREGKLITTNWVDESYSVKEEDGYASVSGNFHALPTSVLTPIRYALLRSVLLTIGRSNKITFLIKKALIKKLITGNKPLPLRFERAISFGEKEVEITDEIANPKGLRIDALCAADVFFSRFVPSSRFFQANELNTDSASLEGITEKLRRGGSIIFKRVINPENGEIKLRLE